MSTEISNQSTLSIPRSLKIIGIIGGTWAILVIFAAVLAYLPKHPDFTIFNTYLSDMGDTPGWPQIFFNSGTLIAVPIRYLVLVLLALRLMQLGAGKSFAISILIVGFLSTAGTALMTATPFSVSPIVHYLSLFPNDLQALQQWHWLGCGMFAVDALRALDPITTGEAGVHIRRAGLQDIEQVMALQDELWEYIKNPPIFILSERYDRKYYEDWLQDPEKVVWLACSRDEPLAFMRLGPAAEDVCAIIVDEQTTSIYAAFTCAPARREGIASALLTHALEHAHACGYQRFAVPFEPMNPLGSRFWLRYFQPVCYSFLRTIDERLTQG